MIRGIVQRAKVVFDEFELRRLHVLESHSAENSLDLVSRLLEDMLRSDPHACSGHGDVDAFALELNSSLSASKATLAIIDCRLDPVLGIVDCRAKGLLFFGSGEAANL